MDIFSTVIEHEYRLTLSSENDCSDALKYSKILKVISKHRQKSSNIPEEEFIFDIYADFNLVINVMAISPKSTKDNVRGGVYPAFSKLLLKEVIWVIVSGKNPKTIQSFGESFFYTKQKKSRKTKLLVL